MTNEIRIMQKMFLTPVNHPPDQEPITKQNYFPAAPDFAPFQVQGSVSSLGGDNSQIQILFPTTDYAIALVESGNGNRRSQLILTTNFVSAGHVVEGLISQEFYIGLGATFSENTIELRFNTAVDAVGSNFPAQQLNEDNVGILPLDSALSLR